MNKLTSGHYEVIHEKIGNAEACHWMNPRDPKGC